MRTNYGVTLFLALIDLSCRNFEICQNNANCWEGVQSFLLEARLEKYSSWHLWNLFYPLSSVILECKSPPSLKLEYSRFNDNQLHRGNRLTTEDVRS